MNKSLVGALAAAVVAAAAAGGYWYGQQRSATGVPAAPGGVQTGQAKGPGGPGGPGGAGAAVAVEAIKVARTSLPQTITAVGSVRSDESVTIRPEVAGRIAAIGFQEGQRVAKGAMLVRLDPAIPQAELQQANANLTLARAKYERAVDLQKRGFISSQARDEAENNLKVAEASVSLAQARFAKTEIKAPFAGLIGLRQVSVGDYVKEGADLVNLESVDPLKLDFRVPEVYLQQVRVGQLLDVTLDALPGRTFEGRVFAINPLVDAAGRSLVIRAQVQNPDAALRPGMFARVRLITKEMKEALVLPEQALVPQGQEQYVFRVVDGKAQRVKVEVGQRGDGRVEILGGVTSDDTVVTAGQLKIRDGTPVQVAGNGGAGAASAKGGAGGAAPAAAKSETSPAAPKS
jgi:membrane fusion protein (multidrug efflux system)